KTFPTPRIARTRAGLDSVQARVQTERTGGLMTKIPIANKRAASLSPSGQTRGLRSFHSLRALIRPPVRLLANVFRLLLAGILILTLVEIHGHGASGLEGDGSRLVHIAAILPPLGPNLVTIRSRLQRRRVKHSAHALLLRQLAIDPDLR